MVAVLENEMLSFDEQIEACREKLLILKSSTGVSLYAAQFFIEHSAYWDHPSAGMVNAPKHADRIAYGDYGYELQFGGNYFLVELAIRRCESTVSGLLDMFEIGNEYTYEELVRKLRLNIRGAVANNDGNEYAGYYPVDGDYMMFGTQSIDLAYFVGSVLATSRIKRMYRF